MTKKGNDLGSEIMHVGIEQPGVIRKSLLNSAILTIQILKRFEIHKRTMKEKDIYRKEFVKHLKDARGSIKEAISMLPETPKIAIRQPEPPKPAAVIKPKIVKEIQIQPREEITREKTHLDKLEDDIDNLKDLIAGL